jgi:hypothetical protein
LLAALSSALVRNSGARIWINLSQRVSWFIGHPVMGLRDAAVIITG